MRAQNQRSYREIFFAHNGPGPYECCFCEEPVHAWWSEDAPEARSSTSFSVHHVDNDRTNGALGNLAASHLGCNARHGALIVREPQAETARRMKIKKAVTKQWAAGARRGRKHTSTAKTRISTGLRRAYEEGRR